MQISVVLAGVADPDPAFHFNADPDPAFQNYKMIGIRNTGASKQMMHFSL